MSDESQDGIARCECGWEIKATTENQAVAAAVGHTYETGHTDLEINGHSVDTGTNRNGRNS